ncbi:MAG: NAD(P)-dependent oxidoreductase [Candidatus Latescibacterota bacterium]
MGAPLKVLVTGVYGLIAGVVYARLAADPRYEAYGLARRRHPSARAPGERQLQVPEDRFFLADVTDAAALGAAMHGMDAVVHMAADPNHDGPWESILANNVVGARNAFDAARQEGVRRVVYASSIMVSWGYQQDEPYHSIALRRFDQVEEARLRRVTHEWPPRPTDYYSASKVWGEALGRFYAEVHGLSVICLRIGWVNAPDTPRASMGMAPIWCSQRDVVQLVERALWAPQDVRFDVFYAVSDNRLCWVDIAHARQVLGYAP